MQIKGLVTQVKFCSNKSKRKLKILDEFKNSYWIELRGSLRKKSKDLKPQDVVSVKCEFKAYAKKDLTYQTIIAKELSVL